MKQQISGGGATGAFAARQRLRAKGATARDQVVSRLLVIMRDIVMQVACVQYASHAVAVYVGKAHVSHMFFFVDGLVVRKSFAFMRQHPLARSC